ncbi:DNA helicase-2 / ATP-dependent DNA helicase PcrA [Paraoerskovia marina]|uniref:DNA 3'-5' helicase n=1 Tax=Paraoerskovia marina TaxID=545619 RepID=A0A1H1UWC8_9CELL|nr:ATP-dependent DNA helicase [Paraoerskovia marina]SDS76827.1 DNA helicase-2 / ATP-dependent DNA helicase PcrA [Paraoerskovia marina]
MSTYEWSAHDIARALHQHPPTPEQVEVIEAPLEPVLVVAGAGSGKTETMASRVVWLIANALVLPEEVLGLTFTRKAAGELSERVRLRLAQLDRVQNRESDAAMLERPTIATYNAYAGSLVADHALRLGLEPGARLLSEATQWQYAAKVVEGWSGDFRTDPAFSTVVDAVLSLSGALSEHLLQTAEARDRIGELVERMQAIPMPAGIKGRTGPYAEVRDLCASLEDRRAVLELVAEYQEVKRKNDALDFGDQIAVAARLAQEVPAVGAAERERHRVVLLDEYQDTSYAQTELLAALYGEGHPVTAVGDPHQSIYGWRGASAAGLGRFPTRFAGPDGRRAAQRALSTSWRNDQMILAVANTTAAPLRAESLVDVPALDARPGAGVGAVRAVYPATVEEEMAAVADFVVERRADAAARGESVTAAVLCRARSQFIPVEAALRARGLPVEVVGLGGLLSTPEVVDVVALLEAAHDPSRGDSLVRILTGPRIGLGVADLHALASRAADLARDDDPRSATVASTADAGADTVDTEAAESAVVEGDVADHRSIVDALDDLPAPGRPMRDGRELTPQAHRRLSALASTLRALRSSTYLSLPELVVEAERALGLDIEVDVAAALTAASDRRIGSGDRGRAHLDAFRDVAGTFSQQSEEPTLGAFLAWLGAASSKERGLDLPLRAPDPAAVQVITVHAAKGLEWDVVAVPGLVDGKFPTTRTTTSKGPTDSAWLKGLGTLPYPLRGDEADLPQLDLDGLSDDKQLKDALTGLTHAAGEHQVAEERRLAYVAFTRARADLLLSGSWWRDGAKPTPPSLFLVELVEAGLVDASGWTETPEGDNPRELDAEPPVWPSDEQDVSASVRTLRTGASLVVERRAAGNRDGGDDDRTLTDGAGTDLRVLADLLLAERDARYRTPRVTMPAHLSASAMVRLAADRDAFTTQLRRPVPQQPTRHARRGTAFHLWAEQYFTSATLLDPFDESDGDAEDTAVDIESLRETFLRSEWARRTPVAIEVDIETPIGGVMSRSRIDAVFPDPDRAHDLPGAVVVVDWKTGRPPSDAAARNAREVQLAVYRLAWSRWKGVPLDAVDAAFFYVGSGETVRPERLLDAAELEALVTGTG